MELKQAGDGLLTGKARQQQDVFTQRRCELKSPVFE
jgi:hypothetical protein